MKKFDIYKIAITLLFTAICASAIKVSPAVFTARNVPLGKMVPLGLELKVYNDSDDTMSYTLEVVKPANGVTLLEGYSPIASKDFFVVEGGESSLAVPPKSVASRMMFSNIPEKDEFYNQMWAVSVVVTGGSGMFKTAVATKYYIETPSRETKSPPFGEVATMPSAVHFQKDENRATFKLLNNGNEPKSFVIEPFVPDAASDRVTIDATQGWRFSAAFADSIECVPASVDVEAGGSREIEVELKGDFGKAEALLRIETKDGGSKVVRVFSE